MSLAAGWGVQGGAQYGGRVGRLVQDGGDQAGEVGVSAQGGLVVVGAATPGRGDQPGRAQLVQGVIDTGTAAAVGEVGADLGG